MQIYRPDRSLPFTWAGIRHEQRPHPLTGELAVYMRSHRSTVALRVDLPYVFTRVSSAIARKRLFSIPAEGHDLPTHVARQPGFVPSYRRRDRNYNFQ